ncbi:MAG: methyltransferase [Candidatus Cloacimonetes bacterium]|nr:methyltransferase [Candidatus Cloacimonadota bacterium]
MISTFTIPGYEIDFLQSSFSQAVSSDAFLLYKKANELISESRFTAKEIKDILDVGTGCGILLLMLAKDFYHCTFTGVEIVADLAQLATENLNRLTQYIGARDYQIIAGDLRRVRFDKKYDLIISNPPYHKKESGRLPAVYEKAIARFELVSTLKDVICCVKNSLSTAGRALLVYPYSRKQEIELACTERFLTVVDCHFADTQTNTLHHDESAVKSHTKVIYEITHADI